jgi:hypothetical protein
LACTIVLRASRLAGYAGGPPSTYSPSDPAPLAIAVTLRNCASAPNAAVTARPSVANERTTESLITTRPPVMEVADPPADRTTDRRSEADCPSGVFVKDTPDPTDSAEISSAREPGPPKCSPPLLVPVVLMSRLWRVVFGIAATTQISPAAAPSTSLSSNVEFAALKYAQVELDRIDRRRAVTGTSATKAGPLEPVARMSR